MFQRWCRISQPSTVRLHGSHGSPGALRNSTSQKSRHVLGTDQYIAPEAYEGVAGTDLEGN